MRVREVLLFTVLRILLFAAPFGILLLLGIDWWWAALIAAVVGFCLSYILLRPQRDAVASRLVAARSAPATQPRSDEDAEDADR